MGSAISPPMPPPAGVEAPQVFVSVADLRSSNNPHAVISTVALGSCLGITCYDPITKIGALLHAMLPLAHKYPDLKPNAARCVDTGVPALLDAVVKLGGNRTSLELKVFGGAQILQANEYFSIGRQNVDVMKAIVADHHLRVTVWDVGGSVNRSIKLNLSNGRVHLRMPNRMEVAV